MIDRIKKSAATIIVSLVLLSAALYVLANTFHPDDKSVITDDRSIISFDLEDSSTPQGEPTVIVPSADGTDRTLPTLTQEPTITQDHKTVYRYPAAPSPSGGGGTPIVNGSRPDVVST